MLKTWPHIKIWHAGCATGEEVYSLAVILQEEGLYDHATIYATDFNDASVAKAKAGIYKLGSLQEASENYHAAGGTHSFSDYYYARYGSAAIDSSLKRRIVFANHNLVSDGVFGEMNLIFCRNVLIYFNAELKSRVLNLFADSLARGGYLCLGTQEALQFTSVEDAFELVDLPSRIYRLFGERAAL